VAILSIGTVSPLFKTEVAAQAERRKNNTAMHPIFKYVTFGGTTCNYISAEV
jgi:hypothetical protein